MTAFCQLRDEPSRVRIVESRERHETYRTGVFGERRKLIVGQNGQVFDEQLNALVYGEELRRVGSGHGGRQARSDDGQ